jgi:hypothetical protein
MTQTSGRVPAYTPDHPPVPASDELRVRIPGWGATASGRGLAGSAST